MQQRTYLQTSGHHVHHQGAWPMKKVFILSLMLVGTILVVKAGQW